MKIPPALGALLGQMAAFLLVFSILSPIFERFGGHFPIIALAFLQGIFAALFCLRLERWWLFIQLFFLPTVVFVSSYRIASDWFLLGFFLLGIVFWNAFRTRVPLYLSGKAVRLEIEKRLPEGMFSFADLGSGLGGMAIELARKKPGGEFFGIEIAPLPYCVGKARAFALPNCKMEWGDYEKVDLSGFDFVYAYLSPVPMPSLFEKAKREMKPGALLVSNTFPVPGIDADERVEAGASTLYFWRM